MRPQRWSVEIFGVAYDNLVHVAFNLDYVQRRAGRYAETLALSDSKIVNAGVLTNNLAIRRDKFS